MLCCGSFSAVAYCHPADYLGTTGLSSNSTQSSSPAPLVPGVENCREDVFGNGDPMALLKVPLVGSYHRAVEEPEILVRSTVIVVDFGQ